MHVYTEARSVPNACRYPIHAFGTLCASVYTCIIDIYVEILTVTVARMRVVTLTQSTRADRIVYTIPYSDALSIPDRATLRMWPSRELKYFMTLWLICFGDSQ